MEQSIVDIDSSRTAITATSNDKPAYKKTLRQALYEQKCVMHAVILRDIRSRFFDNALGFLLVPLFPFVHLSTLLIAYQIVGRRSPYGDDIYLFFSTGLLPSLMFMYTSRFMAQSLLQNKPMMSFPIVKLIDIVFARAFLEIFGALLSALFVFCALLAVGSTPFPHNPFDAMAAFFVTAVLAVGCGIIISCVVIRFPLFTVVWALFCVLLYLLSGTIFLLTNLPIEIGYYLSFNPLVHSVDWMRSAFYPGYTTPLLNKEYLISLAICSVFVGLCVERRFRAFALSS